MQAERPFAFRAGQRELKLKQFGIAENHSSEFQLLLRRIRLDIYLPPAVSSDVDLLADVDLLRVVDCYLRRVPAPIS